MTADRESRGVKVARHTIDGYPVLYAIKRNGDRLKRIVVLRPNVDRGAAAAWLAQQLELHDPLPRLVVEAPAVLPPSPPPPPPESSVQYAMRLARRVQIAGTIRRIG